MDVAITFPNEDFYLDVARLVFGGAALRLDLGYEVVDDIQLAIESVLTPGLCRADEVTLEIRAAGSELAIWLGPLDSAALEARLHEDGHGLSLTRVLEQLVDAARPTMRDEATGMLLVKRLPDR